MASLGDLYFTFRGDGARLQADAVREGEKAGAAAGTAAGKGFGSRMKGALSGANLRQGLVQGLGIGAALGAWGALDTAISTTIGFLGDSTSKASEEAAGIAKLEQALEANVAGYDGNREAIEEVIAARERLGFSDGEQRDSLSTLLGVYKDEEKALEVQRQAMDLARFAGVDLATASDAIAKAHAGQDRALRSLVPGLKSGATATDTIAAAMAAATGQAETFAASNEGAAAATAIAFENFQEEIGEILLPVMQAVGEFGRDVLIPVLREIVANVKAWVSENQPLLQALGQVIGFLVGTGFEALRAWIGILMTAWGVIGDVIGAVARLGTTIGTTLKGGIEAIGGFVAAVLAIPGQIVQIATDLATFFGGIASDLLTGTETLVNGIVGFFLGIPGRIATLGRNLVSSIIGGMASLPGMVADTIRRAFANLKIDIGPFHISASGVRIDLPNIELPKFATGVQNFGGGLAVVGEQGPEVVRLPRGSDVIPNHRLATAAPSNVDQSVSITIGQATRQTAADIHREMQMIQGARRLKGTLGTPRG